MGFPNSTNAYPDVQELLDRALASAKGLKLTFADEKQATFNLGRIHAYRRRLAAENKRIYPADHSMHGQSGYEGLMVKLRGNIVEIEKLSAERFNVEELS